PYIAIHRPPAEPGIARAVNLIRSCGAFHDLSLVPPQLLLAAWTIAVNYKTRLIKPYAPYRGTEPRK
ncbi:hypothetical protein RA267_30535, partial [Pseudomonas syringae pv. tagetis]|uniref:hypothetical protein n=1 Tax=Pseudomonas syringae group genomosp. 7 TaxID=251699 RepID=UPI00376F502C